MNTGGTPQFNFNGVFMKKVLLFSAALALAFPAAASAAEFINFESNADGSASVAGAAVTTDFSALGVTFLNAFYQRCGGGCPTPTTGLFVSSSDLSSPFSVKFAGTTNAFSFANVSNSSGTASAFDSAGNLLQSINFSGFNFDGPPVMFSFATTGINSISFSSTRGFGVDNFSFGDVQGAVPEPATWMMMLLGMAGIGFSMRRKKDTTLRVRYA